MGDLLVCIECMCDCAPMQYLQRPEEGMGCLDWSSRGLATVWVLEVQRESIGRGASALKPTSWKHLSSPQSYIIIAIINFNTG